MLAVVYLQNSGLLEAYGEEDRAWLEGYAAAVGRLFGLSFRQALQERELRELRETRRPADDAPEILGDSSHTQALRRALHETFIPAMEVENPEPILVLGERGTGKDLIARYLHAYSSRGRRPLVVVNCAEITDELAASRFFGHKKGSFTGALTDEPGFFRAADGGVLFLDEVAELSPRAQAHLLRVLENHTWCRSGRRARSRSTWRWSWPPTAISTRRCGKGSCGPTSTIASAPWRSVCSPCASARGTSRCCWSTSAAITRRKHRKRTLGFTREALRALVSYDWPGNVRDLARACSLFVIHAQPGAWIDRDLIERCLPRSARTRIPIPRPGRSSGKASRCTTQCATSSAS